MFLALPAPPSRWKQEPKKGALGLPPHPPHPRPPPPPPPPQQWTVSYRSPVTPQHFHQKTDQSLKKTSGARGALRVIQHTRGDWDPERENWGYGKHDGICFLEQSETVPWSDGNVVPLSTEKNTLSALRSNL